MSDIGSGKPDLGEGKRIAGLSLKSAEELLSSACSFASEIARTRGVGDEAASGLSDALRVVTENVIQCGYEGDDSGSINLTVDERSHCLVIGVEDEGLPFDYQRLEEGENSWFRSLLSRDHIAAAHFINRGKEGNRVELVCNLPMEDIRQSLPPPPEATRKEEKTPRKVDFGTRLMEVDEARDLARLVYRCYGYSYACDFVYYPEKSAARIRDGLMVSRVALSPEGEIVGHLALNFHRPGARVAESGQAVVDPRYRGQGLFKTLKHELRDYGASEGLRGIYSEAVTVHPYSQKGNLALGAREIGFMLGYSPGTVTFEKIDEGGHDDRQSVALMYLPVREEGEEQVHVPGEYAALIEGIYARNGLPRKVVARAPAGTADTAAGSLHLTLRPDHQQAFITVTEIGADSASIVESHRRRLGPQGIRCLYVDLPLDQPESSALGSALRKQGFFFGAVIPSYEKGDVLRMQYLHEVAIDPGDIHVASAFAGELLRETLRDREAAFGKDGDQGSP